MLHLITLIFLLGSLENSSHDNCFVVLCSTVGIVYLEINMISIKFLPLFMLRKIVCYYSLYKAWSTKFVTQFQYWKTYDLYSSILGI